MASEMYDYFVKLVMIGDSDVGKTQILQRYCRDVFDPDSTATIGVEFATRTVPIDGKIIKAQIWDTAGQERYRCITQSYYRGAAGFILVYDTTNYSSFKNCPKWLSEIRHSSDSRAPVMLVGSKTDLQDERKVPTDEGKTFADENGNFFFETSSLDGTNIEPAFQKLIEEICLKSVDTKQKSNTVKLPSEPASSRATRESLTTFTNDHDHMYKILIVGESGSGKSQLFLRYTCDEFNVDSENTVSIELAFHNVTVDGKTIKAQLWDVPGRHRAPVPMYYRGALGVMIVYDISNRASFLNAQIYLQPIKLYADPDVVVMLVGNKCDLGNARAVSREEAHNFASQHDFMDFEASALDGTRVNDAFTTLIKAIHRRSPSHPKDDVIDVAGQLEEKLDYIFKILIVGESGCGKSQLFLRYTKNEFHVDSEYTVGIDLAIRNVIVDGKILKAQIWDTAGQERFRAIIPSYYRKAVGVMIVYDIFKRDTFRNVEHFIDHINAYAHPRIVVMLVGNKCDLESVRTVTTEEADNFAKNHSFMYCETSALDGTNVDVAFATLIEAIYRRFPSLGRTSNTTRVGARGDEQKTRCCPL